MRPNIQRLLWVKRRNTRGQQMFSAVPPTSDIRRAMFVGTRQTEASHYRRQVVSLVTAKATNAALVASRDQARRRGDPRILFNRYLRHGSPRA